MPKAVFRELFEKFLQDNMTPEEVRKFRAMAKDRRNRLLLDRLLRDAYKRVSPLESLPPQAAGGGIDDIFREIMARASQEEVENIPRYPSRIVGIYRQHRVTLLSAAAILCMVVAGIFSYHKYVAGTVEGGTAVHAAMGERKKFILPDGSQVFLNAGSTLTLSDGFNDTGRVVSLSGEAYFDVAKNAHLPFEIHTSSMDIKVLGTSFNVRAYPYEANDIASLIDGKIEVRTKDQKYYLSPLQKIIVRKDNASVSVPRGKGPDLQIDSLQVSHLVDQVPEIAWTQNKLFFDAEPLNIVMDKIAKWYGVTVRLDNKEIGNLHFTGSYQNESLEDVMAALELANPQVHHRMEANEKLLIVY